jgi:phage/conjugal plasmid C-4 type zinc finger TraR family protein
MATGWARDGAIEEQINDTVVDAVSAARARLPSGESALGCEGCGDPIPEPRRKALPGVKTCLNCQSRRDRQVVHSTFNRRGSKDSQLR